MPDNMRWTTVNLNIDIAGSYCYDNSEAHCRRFGRLYTWEAAQKACEALGRGWRLPADDEWRQLAAQYGGVSADSEAKSKTAYKALLDGGDSGFNAVLGGNRDSKDGTYARLDAHGFYWTSTDGVAGTAPFYNFGKGGQMLHRQSEGEKSMAISVRCVRHP